MNKLDEYKSKIQWDVWADITPAEVTPDELRQTNAAMRLMDTSEAVHDIKNDYKY